MTAAPLLCVCLKPVLRTDVPLRLDAAGHAPRDTEALLGSDGAQTAALRLALGLRAAVPGTRLLALSVGAPAAEDVLRGALAAGADAVVRVWGADWGAALPPPAGTGEATRALAVAAAEALRERAPALVLTGAHSADTGHECFGAYLAAALGAAYAHRATVVEPGASGQPGWRVTVRLERGYGQVLALAAPAVVTVSALAPRLAEPALPAWLAARAAPVPLLAAAGPPPHPAATQLRVPLPRVKRYRRPAPGLGAEARIRALVTLEAQGGGAVLSEGSPAEQAEAILARLRQDGYLP